MLIKIFDLFIDLDSIESIFEQEQINPDFIPEIEGVVGPTEDKHLDPFILNIIIRSKTGKEYIFKGHKIEEFEEIYGATKS